MRLGLFLGGSLGVGGRIGSGIGAALPHRIGYRGDGSIIGADGRRTATEQQDGGQKQSREGSDLHGMISLTNRMGSQSGRISPLGRPGQSSRGAMRS